MGEINKFKASARNKIDMTLLAACFAAFTFLASNSPEILRENFFLTFQLVFAIPLFMNNLFSRIKQAYKDTQYKWNGWGLISFTLAFGFFINFLGLLLALFVSLKLVLIFFSLNIFLALVRFSIHISYEPKRFRDKFIREIFHIALVIFLGVLPAIKVY